MACKHCFLLTSKAFVAGELRKTNPRVKVRFERNNSRSNTVSVGSSLIINNIDEDVSDILKHRFIKLYMTTRGFAYASLPRILQTTM